MNLDLTPFPESFPFNISASLIQAEVPPKHWLVAHLGANWTGLANVKLLKSSTEPATTPPSPTIAFNRPGRESHEGRSTLFQMVSASPKL